MSFTHHAGMDAKTSTKQQLIQDLLIALFGGVVAIWASIAVLHSRGHAVEDWQTLLAAIFGVIGLGLAHFLTVSHQRQRDEEQRDVQTKAIATALRAEIISFNSFTNAFLTRLYDDYPDPKVRIIPVPETLGKMITFPETVILNAFIDRVDMLPKSTIERVLLFYIFVDGYNRGLEANKKIQSQMGTLMLGMELGDKTVNELDKIIDP